MALAPLVHALVDGEKQRVIADELRAECAELRLANGLLAKALDASRVVVDKQRKQIRQLLKQKHDTANTSPSGAKRPATPSGTEPPLKRRRTPVNAA